MRIGSSSIGLTMRAVRLVVFAHQTHVAARHGFIDCFPAVRDQDKVCIVSGLSVQLEQDLSSLGIFVSVA